MRPYKTTVALVLLSFSLALAQDSLTCLDKASAKIKPEEKITLLKTDGHKITGRLSAIDLTLSQLSIYRPSNQTKEAWSGYFSSNQGEIARDTVMVLSSDFTQIRYYRRGHFRPGTVFLSTGIGAVLLGIVGAASAEPDYLIFDYTAAEGFAIGAMAGSVLGFVTGTTISLLTPTARKIECK